MRTFKRIFSVWNSDRGQGPLFLALMMIVALGVGGCASNQGDTSGEALYQQLGGEAGINKLVSLWLTNAGQDPVLKPAFAHADMAHLQAQMVTLIGQDAGGPQVYTGPDMYAAHQGMHITDAQWDAFMHDLHKAMQTEQISNLTQAELLGILLPMKTDIVGH